MEKKILVCAAFAAFFIILPECGWSATSQVDTSNFAGMSAKLDGMKAFATQTVLPFGGVLGAVYGAFKSYMSSSPWPFLTFGATAIAATLGPSLIDTTTWTAILP